MSRREVRNLRPSQGGRLHAPVYPIHGLDPRGFPNPSPAEIARVESRNVELAAQRKRLVGCIAHRVVNFIHDSYVIEVLPAVKRVDLDECGVIRAYGDGWDSPAADIDPPIDVAKITQRLVWPGVDFKTEPAAMKRWHKASEGWSLAEYKTNPTVLFNHEPSSVAVPPDPPVGPPDLVWDSPDCREFSGPSWEMVPWVHELPDVGDVGAMITLEAVIDDIRQRGRHSEVWLRAIRGRPELRLRASLPELNTRDFERQIRETIHKAGRVMHIGAGRKANYGGLVVKITAKRQELRTKPGKSFVRTVWEVLGDQPKAHKPATSTTP